MFRSTISLAGLCLLFAALPAQAKDKDQLLDGPPPAVFQAVIDCKATSDPAARLACYDQAVNAMVAARSARDLVVTDRATVREAKRGLFGLSLPSIKLFDGGKDEEVKEIRAAIKSARSGPEGYVFTLDDGATWAQTDSIYIPEPRAGAMIQIRQAALGSYFGKVEGGAAFRIKRRNQ